MGEPVGPAADDLVLRAEVSCKPLKDHAGVVVKPPRYTEVRLVIDTLCIKECKRLLDSRAFRHIAGDLKDLSDRLALRERREGLAEVAEILLIERRLERTLIALVEAGHDRPLVLLGEGGEEMLHRREVADAEIKRCPARPDHISGEHDHLGVGARRIGPDELDTELPELPVPPLLRAFVAETVGDVAPADRLWEDFPLIDVHPEHRRRHLGPERHLPAPLVLECVHLLDDPLTRLHREEFQVLKIGRADLPVSPPAGRLPHPLLDQSPPFHLVGQKIPCSPWFLKHSVFLPDHGLLRELISFVRSTLPKNR